MDDQAVTGMGDEEVLDIKQDVQGEDVNSGEATEAPEADVEGADDAEDTDDESVEAAE